MAPHPRRERQRRGPQPGITAATQKRFLRRAGVKRASSAIDGTDYARRLMRPYTRGVKILAVTYHNGNIPLKAVEHIVRLYGKSVYGFGDTRADVEDSQRCRRRRRGRRRPTPTSDPKDPVATTGQKTDTGASQNNDDDDDDDDEEEPMSSEF